jgi:hypothetical protein
MSNQIYCDVDGVSYATASKIHVTSDVIIATQRLRVLRLITQYNFNCWKFLSNRLVEIRSNANTGNKTLRQGVFSPGRQHPTSGVAEK